MHIADDAASARPNHPKAPLMAAIAALVFNIGVGIVMGTSGVLLPHMKQHLGVSTEMVSLALVAVMLTSSIVAPQIGALAVKHSLRKIVMSAGLMLSATWLLLDFTHSYAVYIAAYALLMGPTMAITGSVFAPTLVTRWFSRNRGLAIGLVHLPIMVAIMPLALEWLIQHIGLNSTFLLLAVVPLVTILPAGMLVIDWPEDNEAADQAAPAPTASHGPSVTIGQMLGQRRFWALTLAAGMPNTSSILLALHLVSMAESWHIMPLAAAGLASIMSLVGMVGVVTMGWFADRVGGARSLAVICACDAVLWLLFLLGLPYAGIAAVVGMIGFFGAGTVPSISKAYADAFGRESFSRAIGLLSPVTLPMMFVGLIAPGMVVRAHGNYNPVLVVMAGCFVVACVLAALASRQPAPDQSR